MVISTDSTTTKTSRDYIRAQKTKPILAEYFYSTLFSPMTSIVLKAIRKFFLKTWPGITERLINKYLKKSMNNAMVHLHMK